MNPGSSAVPSAGVGDKGLGCWRWGGGWTHTPSCVQVGQDGVGDDLGDGGIDDGDCLQFYLERESFPAMHMAMHTPLHSFFVIP